MRSCRVVVIALGIALLGTGCRTSSMGRQTTISSDRQVEELVFENGAANWRKVGNLSVGPQSEKTRGGN